MSNDNLSTVGLEAIKHTGDTEGVRLWEEACALMPKGARIESTRWGDGMYSVHVQSGVGGWEIHLSDVSFAAVMARIVESLRESFPTASAARSAVKVPKSGGDDRIRTDE